MPRSVESGGSPEGVQEEISKKPESGFLKYMSQKVSELGETIRRLGQIRDQARKGSSENAKRIEDLATARIDVQLELKDKVGDDQKHIKDLIASENGNTELKKYLSELEESSESVDQFIGEQTGEKVSYDAESAVILDRKSGEDSVGDNGEITLVKADEGAYYDKTGRTFIQIGKGDNTAPVADQATRIGNELKNQARGNDPAEELQKLMQSMKPTEGQLAGTAIGFRITGEHGDKITISKNEGAKGTLYILDLESGTMADPFSEAPATAQTDAGVLGAVVDAPKSYYVLDLSTEVTSKLTPEQIIEAAKNANSAGEVAFNIRNKFLEVNPGDHGDIGIIVYDGAHGIAAPNPVPEPTPITDVQRKEADKRVDNIIKAMEIEEKSRLIQRGLDRGGFFKALFFQKKIIKEVEEKKEFHVTQEIRAMVEEYALQRLTNQQQTASGNEIFRLMQTYGFEINPQTGEFQPQHADSNWISRLVHFDRTKATGTTFVGGMALGMATRAGLATVLDGAARSVGAGAITGGLFGWLRGRREGAEATGSGASWLSEIKGALDTGRDAEIELACHKVERIFGDPQARQEFFRGRTRMEAARLLEQYQEGIRRLALIRMSQEATTAEGTPESERNGAVADRYAAFCREMARGERQFMETYCAEYSSALAGEVGIIAVDANGQPVPGAQNNETIPVAPVVPQGYEGAREQVITGFARDSRERRSQRRRIVAQNVIRGAVVGGIAGGVGWYVGNWLSGLIHGGEHAAAGTGGATTGHEAVGGGVVTHPSGTGVEHQTWGYFTNENTMPQQGFTAEHANALGFGHLMNDPRCPTSIIEGHAYVGTDQGAALHEAVNNWQDQLNFHGMNQAHATNLMNFAGSHDNALPVDVGAGYHLSREQAQAVIDHVWNNGSPIDANIFDANQILAGQGMEHAVAAAAIVTPDALHAATQETAQGIWPGWLLLAGAGGLAGGYGIDSALRNRDLQNTADVANSNRAGRPKSGDFGAINSYGQEPTPPVPEPTPAPEPTPTPPAPEPDPNRAEREQLEGEKQGLLNERTNLQRRVAELSLAGGIENLINANDPVYTELASKPEGDKINFLAAILSQKRSDSGYTVEAIENAYSDPAQADEKTAEYAKWDYIRAEKIVDILKERDEAQARIAAIDARIVEIDTRVAQIPVPENNAEINENGITEERYQNLFLDLIASELRGRNGRLEFSRRAPERQAFQDDNGQGNLVVTALDPEARTMHVSIEGTTPPRELNLNNDGIIRFFKNTKSETIRANLE